MSSNAIASLVDDSTVLDYMVMMHSFKQSNSRLYDTVDKYCFTFGELSEQNRQLIKAIHPSVQERKIDTDNFTFVPYSGGRDWCKTEKGYKPHYRYEIFELEGYDNLVYLDNDLLILKNIEELFNTPEGKVGVCRKWHRPLVETFPCFIRYPRDVCGATDGDDYFNAGVMSFGKNVPTRKLKQDMLKLQCEMNSAGNQQPFNEMFKDKTIFLPASFNFASENSSLLEGQDYPAILHYVGQKKPSHSFCQRGKNLSLYNLIYNEDNKSLYNNIDQSLNKAYPNIIKLGFADYQLNALGTNNALILWKKWFDIFRQTGLWIESKNTGDINYD